MFHLLSKLALVGNVGVSPFYLLFLIALVSKNGNGASLGLLGSYNTLVSTTTFQGLSCFAAILELVGKCIPVVDSALDSAQVFIVPIIAAFVCLATGATIEGGGRLLSDDNVYIVTIGKVLFIGFGSFLALAVHVTKMIIRALGVGWLTTVLTVVELLFCTLTLLAVVFFQTAASFVGVVFLFCSLRYMLGLAKKEREKEKETTTRRCRRRKKKETLLG
ncbi:hypothetical protein TrST_g12657 [Triparma strigata]|uniref:DUF4126 domain-containing protein n=1 Tax=Triparma strigata TaxID=1606541 RepID=A0A9W7F161_9STRA|nr:hypothetical protein TrST_g12657 [Triparma strigata]